MICNSVYSSIFKLISLFRRTKFVFIYGLSSRKNKKEHEKVLLTLLVGMDRNFCGQNINTEVVKSGLGYLYQTACNDVVSGKLKDLLGNSVFRKGNRGKWILKIIMPVKGKFEVKSYKKTDLFE